MKTILLVDADGDCAAIVNETADSLGYSVRLTKTSRDAFAVLRDSLNPNLVVVDVDPGAHGLALLEAISACADRPPVVVLTSLEETYMKPIAAEHGAVACLGKPVARQRLRCALHHASQHSLTCDRWGCVVPSTGDKAANLTTCFRGIAAKLSP